MGQDSNSSMPHYDEIEKEKSAILGATPGKPGEHPAQLSNFSHDLSNALNEGGAYKYNFAHQLDSAAAFFLSDNVGLPGVAYYFKLVAVAQRADAFNLVKYVVKRGGCPTIGSVSRFHADDWSEKDRGDVLSAFASALATAKVGLAYTNKAFQLALSNYDAETNAFLSKAAFAWSEQIREWGAFVNHLKLVRGDKHAVKNFDRSIACSKKTLDLAKAASIEAVAPPELQMGVYTRLRRCQSTTFEAALEAHGNLSLGE